MEENKFVGDLQHDARAVAGLAVCTFGTAVFHIFQHLERAVYEFVAFVAMDIDNHAHAARVVFIVGAVEPGVKSFVLLHVLCL